MRGSFRCSHRTDCRRLEKLLELTETRRNELVATDTSQASETKNSHLIIGLMIKWLGVKRFLPPHPAYAERIGSPAGAAATAWCRGNKNAATVKLS